MTTFKQGALAAALAASAFGFPASADDRQDRFRIEFSGFNEVHFIAGPPAALRGAVSTSARGRFRAEIDDRQETVEYDLRYEDLEGDVTQAHIHFGQKHTVGGIVVWLCQTTAAPAPAAVSETTPTCPGPRSGHVQGTFGPGSVLTVAGQGIDAGQFEELLRAMRAGATYANVHTTLFPPGEIRGHLGGHEHD
jgi:hypothetical protein